MRSFARGAALALLISDAVEAARFARAVSGNGYLAVPVGTVDRPKRLKKRQDDEEGDSFVTVLDNMDFFYATDIDIGNPPQTVTVLVDTGSSELWVNPDCDTAPSLSQQEQCFDFGHYNPSDSETPPIGPFGSEEINYGDPSDPATLTSVVIEYYTDDLALGDARITNQTFGVVTESRGQSQGIFGLAPDMVAGVGGDAPYSLILNSMAEQGVIASRVFALDLRHAEAETGAVIYGGIDRNKFIGKLESRPIIRGMYGEYRLGVRLDTMGVTSDGNSYNYELQGDDTNVMLDSGTTISRMHYASAWPILEALGAVDDGEGYYYVDCQMRSAGGSIDFGFGSKTVRVPLSDFILDIGALTYCAVGMVITTEQQILGDSVLRAGYFVFDWDNEAVHIAQAANCGDNDIVAVGSGADAVPSVTGNCDESDALFDGDADDDSEPTRTLSETATRPTGAYTTTYTITSCPAFDRACQTGLVTTQTFDALDLAPTETPSSGGDGNEDDDGNEGDEGDEGDDENDDGAGVRSASAQWTVLMFVTIAVVYNVL